MTPAPRVHTSRSKTVGGAPAGEGERAPRSPWRPAAVGSALLLAGVAANLLLLAAIGALALASAARRYGSGREHRPLAFAFGPVLCGVAMTLALNGLGRAGTPWSPPQIEAALAVPVAVSAVTVAVATTLAGLRLLTSAPVTPTSSVDKVWTDIRALPFVASSDVILSEDKRTARLRITAHPDVELVDVLAATRAALRAHWVVHAELDVSWPHRDGSDRLRW